MCNDYRSVLLRIDSSVLSDISAYRRVATLVRKRFLATPYERYVLAIPAKVSLPAAIQKTARRVARFPGGRIFGLLCAAHEFHFAACLALELEKLGIATTALNVHETGIKVVRQNSDFSVSIDPNLLHMALAAHSAVVLATSLATSSEGAIVVLNSNSVDAVTALITESMGILRCEVIKDVSGRLQSDIYSTYAKLGASRATHETGCKRGSDDEFASPFSPELAFIENDPFQGRGDPNGL
jgi:aspartokinase